MDERAGQRAAPCAAHCSWAKLGVGWVASCVLPSVSASTAWWLCACVGGVHELDLLRRACCQCSCGLSLSVRVSFV